MILSERPQWLQEKLSLSLNKAQQLGWPQSMDESWRYSSPEVLVKVAEDFKSTLNTTQNNFSLPEEVKSLASGADHVLYFYNGAYLDQSQPIMTTEVNVAPILVNGLGVEGAATTLLNYELLSLTNKNLKGLRELNTALFNNGSHIKICSKKIKPKVALIYIYGNLIDQSEQRPFSVAIKNIIEIEEASQAEIFETHVAINNIAFSVNNRTQIKLAANSVVEYVQTYWLGDEAYLINDNQGLLNVAARLNFFSFINGSRQIRNENLFELRGEQAHLGHYNLAKAEDKHLIDSNSNIQHMVGNTISDQIIKNILLGPSKISFSGQLKINEGAQKSDASQYCYNLLMHPEAEANTKPQLEVLADDVKAAHGATVGQVNVEDLFYIQSRAISKVAAEKLLAHGFQKELADKINSSFLKEKWNFQIEGASL